MPRDDGADRPELPVIGWKELVGFPEWGLRGVRAKADTGACTSAIDAAGYEVIQQDGRAVVRLRLALYRLHPERVAVVEAPLVRLARVCNPGGCREERPVIEALVRLGPVRKRIQLTVTDRSVMRHPVILGREALAGSFLVDPARRYGLRCRKRGGTK
jgi:hypothetical protein